MSVNGPHKQNPTADIHRSQNPRPTISPSSDVTRFRSPTTDTVPRVGSEKQRQNAQTTE